MTENLEQEYEAVCAVDDVGEHIPRKVEVNGRGVLICRNDDDQLYAVDEICPHKNQSMERAPIINGEIICPHHQYRFDLRTGRCNRRCAPVQTYDLEVRDNQVWVKIG